MSDKKIGEMLKSFEELERLLPERDRKEVRKEKKRKAKETEYKLKAKYACYDGRPAHMRTSRRILPMFPKWMIRKITAAHELYHHNNIWCDDDYVWNHVVTLPLDEVHEVTFSILDPFDLKTLFFDIQLLVDVYKDLQVLYARYGHPLTIVSLQTADYGMVLPESFYVINHELSGVGIEDPMINIFMSNLAKKDFHHITPIERYAVEYAETLSAKDRIRFNTWFVYEHKRRTDYLQNMDLLLNHSVYNYQAELMWNHVDLYMHHRHFGRELCVKWPMAESVENIRQLDRFRPLINKIISKTAYAKFSFGVKPKYTDVIPCHHVMASMYFDSQYMSDIDIVK